MIRCRFHSLSAFSTFLANCADPGSKGATSNCKGQPSLEGPVSAWAHRSTPGYYSTRNELVRAFFDLIPKRVPLSPRPRVEKQLGLTVQASLRGQHEFAPSCLRWSLQSPQGSSSERSCSRVFRRASLRLTIGRALVANHTALLTFARLAPFSPSGAQPNVGCH